MWFVCLLPVPRSLLPVPCSLHPSQRIAHIHRQRVGDHQAQQPGGVDALVELAVVLSPAVGNINAEMPADIGHAARRLCRVAPHEAGAGCGPAGAGRAKCSASPMRKPAAAYKNHFAARAAPTALLGFYSIPSI